MSELLFDVPAQLSPRLSWMKRHGVSTDKSPCLDDDEEPWNAWAGECPATFDYDKHGRGATEDEAIVALAKANGWPLWNEEGLR